MKQKAAITFEKEETLVVRQTASLLTEFCAVCNATVEMLTPEVMAPMTGSSEREIFRLIEAGVLPFSEKKRIYACVECCRRRIEQGPIEYASEDESAEKKRLAE